jgi:hypothetical protein
MKKLNDILYKVPIHIIPFITNGILFSILSFLPYYAFYIISILYIIALVVINVEATQEYFLLPLSALILKLFGKLKKYENSLDNQIYILYLKDVIILLRREHPFLMEEIEKYDYDTSLEILKVNINSVISTNVKNSKKEKLKKQKDESNKKIIRKSL